MIFRETVRLRTDREVPLIVELVVFLVFVAMLVVPTSVVLRSDGEEARRGLQDVESLSEVGET